MSYERVYKIKYQKLAEYIYAIAEPGQFFNIPEKELEHVFKEIPKGKKKFAKSKTVIWRRK